MALIKLNTRSASSLDATILTGNLPAISGASLTGISADFVKITTVTADNSSATMDVTGASSTYDAYCLVGGLISPASSDSSLECQVINSSGSALTDAWDVVGFDGNSSSQSLLHADINGADFNPSGDENTAYQFSFHMYVFGLNEARQPNIYFAGSNTWASFLTRTIGSVRVGKFANAGSGQQGIRFKFHNGSNFNTGKITMYGLKR